MNSLNLTKIVIGLMGIWLIVRDTPNIVGSLLQLRAIPGLYDHPLTLYYWYDHIPLAHFILSVALGVILISLRTYIAKLLVTDHNETINITARHIENVAILAFPAWMVIDAFLLLAFFGGDTLNDVIRIIIGLILFVVAYYFVWKHRKQ